MSVVRCSVVSVMLAASTAASAQTACVTEFASDVDTLVVDVGASAWADRDDVDTHDVVSPTARSWACRRP